MIDHPKLSPVLKGDELLEEEHRAVCAGLCRAGFTFPRSGAAPAAAQGCNFPLPGRLLAVPRAGLTFPSAAPRSGPCSCTFQQPGETGSETAGTLKIPAGEEIQ